MSAASAAPSDGGGGGAEKEAGGKGGGAAAQTGRGITGAGEIKVQIAIEKEEEEVNI